jgi:SAM-dependent methyltransferase/FKBP-type peptidyl-prolyl cis-trans isomerase 2
MSEKIDARSLAVLHATLQWADEEAHHAEKFYVPLNVWRELDLLPRDLAQALPGQQAGFTWKSTWAPGSLVPPYDHSRVWEFPLAGFDHGRRRPGVGRYYPRELLPGFAQISVPFRCIAVQNGTLQADFNHPLAPRELELEFTVARVDKKRGDTGGVCQDWLQLICDGPGMQARHDRIPTDFLGGEPFARLDEEDDVRFYDRPRLVNHIDAQADAIITALYGELLPAGARVLDLMSSWNSHLPDSLELSRVTGLGLNREEMARNPRLTEAVVHDLNREPVLPFPDHSYDAIICTVSVEYLVHPLDIFREAARVLKPGGLLIHTFSNRWFPPKVIRVWTEILEWERPGLVLEYFLASGAYDRLETFSARGWPRPVTDRYYPQVTIADPMYAVWGRTKG